MHNAIDHLLPRVLTPEDRAVIEDILDMAAEWAAGRMRWQAVASAGTLDWNGAPSVAYARFVALRVTPRTIYDEDGNIIGGDHRWANLQALIDVLVRAEGFTVTRQGVYSSWELREHADAVERAKREQAA